MLIFISLGGRLYS